VNLTVNGNYNRPVDPRIHTTVAIPHKVIYDSYLDTAPYCLQL
jgi:hypothetical protein